MVGYTDADYAMDESHKSQTGTVVKMFESTVSWKSKKQATVAQSTTEAELMALSSGTRLTKFIYNLIKELALFCDDFVGQ